MTKKHHNKPVNKIIKSNEKIENSVDVRTKVIRALNNGRFIARTVEGIAREVSMSRNVVIHALKLDKEVYKQLKVLPRKTSDGRVLITTKDHFNKSASFRDKFIDVFATKRVSVDDIN